MFTALKVALETIYREMKVGDARYINAFATNDPYRSAEDNESDDCELGRCKITIILKKINESEGLDVSVRYNPLMIDEIIALQNNGVKVSKEEMNGEGTSYILSTIPAAEDALSAVSQIMLSVDPELQDNEVVVSEVSNRIDGDEIVWITTRFHPDGTIQTSESKTEFRQKKSVDNRGGNNNA